MTSLQFNFSNAVFHAFRTPGPKGFLLKFMLTYALLTLIFFAGTVALQWPIYEVYLRMIAEQGPIENYVEEINRASMRNLGVSALILPVSLAFYAVFEAASQRRYMRGEGFGLKIGADEGRVLVVALMWFALFIAWYIGFFVMLMLFMLVGALIGMAGGAQAMPVIMIALVVLATLAGFGLLLWAAARFSPAAALTIRDKQIRFFEAWKVTRKKSGTIMLALLTVYLVLIVLGLLIFAPALFMAFSQLAPEVSSGGSVSSADVMAIVRQPSFFGPIALAYALYILINAAALHIFAGPAALAAKTDPSWNGREGVSAEFS